MGSIQFSKRADAHSLYYFPDTDLPYVQTGTSLFENHNTEHSAELLDENVQTTGEPNLLNLLERQT